jgi:hypothetical protein
MVCSQIVQGSQYGGNWIWCLKTHENVPIYCHRCAEFSAKPINIKKMDYKPIEAYFK